MSSFGFSGTNAHVIVEAAPATVPPAPTGAERPVHVLALSAKTPAALGELATRYASALDGVEGDVADVGFSAGTGRAQLEHRLAIVASSGRGGAHAAPVARGRRPHRPGAGSPVDASPARRLSLPGARGAVRRDGAGAVRGERVFRAAVERVAGALEASEGARLRGVIEGAGTAGVDETATAQVALFAVQWGLAEVWRGWGVQPAAVVGHSVGEYAAACVAGVVEVEAAARVVAARGRLMGALPGGGAMAAVSAGMGAVEAALGAVRGTGGGRSGWRR